jgi:K(+)-stimulated pyrophosphate-energized sodium pump
MIWFVIAITIGLYFLYKPIYTKPEEAMVPLGVSIAFLMGVFASYMAGFVGMYIAVRANVRAAFAALSSFKKALGIAFYAGSVSGMATIALVTLDSKSIRPTRQSGSRSFRSRPGSAGRRLHIAE